MTEALARQQVTPMDRRSYIGSSDIAAIIGISPWKTAVDVYMEKVAKDAAESDDKMVFRRGKRAEPYIIEWLQQEKDFWITDRNVRVRHSDHEFLAAEADFLYDIEGTGTAGHGECKSIGQFADWSKWGESGSQDCPDYYIAQILFGMECDGCEEGFIAGAANWDDVRLYPFQRDHETGTALVRIAAEFWHNNVLARVPPAPKTLGDTKRLLTSYGSFDWIASEDALDKVREATSLRAQIKVLEAAQEDADKALLDCLYTAAIAQDVDGKEFKKARVLGADGKPVATLSEIERKGYTVGPTKFTQLRFAKEKA